MAITDAYGNPVEPGTPVIRLYGANGVPLPPRKSFRFDSSITATDDPASDATLLRATPAAPSIPNATESVAGLMSAADKVISDSRVLVHSAPFTSQTAVSSNTWTAGKYRRIQVRVRLSVSAATDLQLALVGLTAGSNYYLSAMKIPTGGDLSQAGTSKWLFDLSSFAGPGVVVKADCYIATDGTYRAIQAQVTGGNGQGLVGTGLMLDTTHDVTGVAIALQASSSGYLEVIGYV